MFSMRLWELYVQPLARARKSHGGPPALVLCPACDRWELSSSSISAYYCGHERVRDLCVDRGIAVRDATGVALALDLLSSMRLISVEGVRPFRSFLRLVRAGMRQS